MLKRFAEMKNDVTLLFVLLHFRKQLFFIKVCYPCYYAYNIVIFNELIKYFKNFSALISNLIPIDTTNIKKNNNSVGFSVVFKSVKGSGG